MATGSSSTGRTRIVVVQTLWGLLLKSGSFAVTFAAVPVALSALGPTVMGAWLVLLSVLHWFTLLDLGVGAGARNEIARAAASGNTEATRRAVTTGALITLALCMALLALQASALAATPIASWLSQTVFDGVDVRTALWLVAAGASVTLALNIVQTAFAALERPAAVPAYGLLANTLFLLLLIGVTQPLSASLEQVVWLYVASMLIANGLLALAFVRLHPTLLPRRDSFDARLIRPIVGGGLQMFAIQLCLLAIFGIDRVLVSAFVGSEAVVVYEGAFRLFAIVTMAHSLLMSSAWSSITQGHARGELHWLRSGVGRLMRLTLPVAAVSLLLALAAGPIVGAWLGPGMVGPPVLYFVFALATILGCWSNLFTVVLNAVGQARVQLWAFVAAAGINVPLAYVLAVKLEFGVVGVVLGACASMLLLSVTGPLLYRRHLALAGRPDLTASVPKD